MKFIALTLPLIMLTACTTPTASNKVASSANAASLSKIAPAAGNTTGSVHPCGPHRFCDDSGKTM